MYPKLQTPGPVGVQRPRLTMLDELEKPDLESIAAELHPGKMADRTHETARMDLYIIDGVD